jgi:hypothetical protein
VPDEPKCPACPVAGRPIPCIARVVGHANFCLWAAGGVLERIAHVVRASEEYAADAVAHGRSGRRSASRPVAHLPSVPPAPVLVAHRRSRSFHGLGVNASHTAGCLSRLGPAAQAVGIDGLADLARLLAASATVPGDGSDGTGHVDHGPGPVRLIILQGRWAEPVADLADLARSHPTVTFVVRIHSNLAFLAIEPAALGWMREFADLALPNLRLAAVSHRLAGEFAELYGPCDHLPNLYDLGTADGTGAGMPGIGPGGAGAEPLSWVAGRGGSGGDGDRDVPGTITLDAPLRMGHLGAPRLQKHVPTGAAAALLIAKRMGCRLDFLINTKDEQGGTASLDMLRSMFAGLGWARLVEVPWAPPAEFRRTMAGLALHVQLSASETFNICCADAAAAGIPSVVGECIDWLPRDFVAPIDDASAAAAVGMRLLADPTAGPRARAALEAQQATATQVWRAWLAARGVLGAVAGLSDGQLAEIAACPHRVLVGCCAGVTDGCDIAGRNRGGRWMTEDCACCVGEGLPR